jgi:hypothetical protein
MCTSIHLRRKEDTIVIERNRIVTQINKKSNFSSSSRKNTNSRSSSTMGSTTSTPSSSASTNASTDRNASSNSNTSSSSNTSASTSTNAVDYQYEGMRDQLTTMLQQEKSGTYKCVDYLSSLSSSKSSSASLPGLVLESDSDSETTTATNDLSSIPIDVECRIKMIQWCFQVIDYAKFKRSTASIAMTLLDRFLSKHETSPSAKQALYCRKAYQLTCMTTLYMAIKLNEKSDVDGSVFSELSRDMYSEDEIVAMEMNVLSTLSWRLCGPSSLDFLTYMLSILPQQQSHIFDSLSLANVADLSGFQIDLAVGDYYFVTQKQSTIAIAALLNALESKSNDDSFALLMEEIRIITNIDVSSSPLIEAARSRLQYLLASNGVKYQAKVHDKVYSEQKQRSSRRSKGRKGAPVLSSNSSSRSLSSSSSSSSTLTKSTSTSSTTSSCSPICVSRITRVSRRTIIHRSSSFQDSYHHQQRQQQQRQQHKPMRSSRSSGRC